ncbi:hypothetical protein [Lysobacter gummosus]|uniref:hypothetical protein n=1 Tax=Lysobacter gummosus TaxID=262324 RepID=UPI003643ACE2
MTSKNGLRPSCASAQTTIKTKKPRPRTAGAFVCREDRKHADNPSAAPATHQPRTHFSCLNSPYSLSCDCTAL